LTLVRVRERAGAWAEVHAEVRARVRVRPGLSG
jgi:hypothetical protein